MDPRYEAIRLIDSPAALQLASRLAERERWPRERLERIQQRAPSTRSWPRARPLALLPRAASAAGAVELAALPVLDKADADGALRRHRVRPAPATRRAARAPRRPRARRRCTWPLPRDDHQRLVRPQGPVRLRPRRLGRDRAIPALQRVGGHAPRVPRRRMARDRRRLPDPHEPARRGHAVGRPAPDARAARHACRCRRMVEALNAFRPDCLHAYPSMAVAAGRRAARRPPARSPRGRHHLERAAARRRWPRGSRTRSASARSTSTRPPRACGARECEQRGGHHLFEDLAIVENVDEDGRAGARRRARRAAAGHEPRPTACSR